MMRALHPWCAVVLALGTASCITASAWTQPASTIVVDAANGPGAHYTDLPPAIAAAQAGDLVLVRPGEYSAFILSKALTIVGAPNGASRVTSTQWTPITVVGGIAEDDVVAIADLDFSSVVGAWGTHGTVAFDACKIGRLITTSADDVRVCRAPHVGRAQIQGSHVEIVSSAVGGGVVVAGAYGQGMVWAGSALAELYAKHIWPTVELKDQSKLVCASTSVRGRHVYLNVTGTNVLLWPYSTGTSACLVASQSALALIGTNADVVRGGDGAYQFGVNYTEGTLGPPIFGAGGHGLDLQSGTAARSGVQLLGGVGGPPNPLWPILFPGYTTDGSPVAGPEKDKLVPIIPDNPTLELLDTPKPGAKVRLRVRGPAGSEVVVAYGAPTIVPVTATRPIETLVATSDRLRPGDVPASGEMTFEADVPAALTTGSHVFLQAHLILPSGAARASNSIVLVAR